jgi:hypothetical protein
MNKLSNQLIGLALLGVLTVALLLAPIHAKAATLATDSHDIPTYVLEHVELTPGVGARAG